MRIEAKDLQSALTEASKSLECSVIDLEYEIIQHSKSGFLGFWRKNAIIEARAKKQPYAKKNPKKDFNIHKNDIHKNHEKSYRKFDDKNKSEVKKEIETEFKEIKPKEKYVVKSDGIFDSFHKESRETRNKEDVLDEIRIQLEYLLKSTCFNISLVELRMYDEESVFIRLDGDDAALLIGKEAHRYKAISYLLHNWINLKYNLLVRLEIAQFLENQIQGMQIYLQGVIEKIKLNGRGQTKPLDGVLIKIALEKLRAEFPDKYVGIKQNNDQRYVVINDFFKKDE